MDRSSASSRPTDPRGLPELLKDLLTEIPSLLRKEVELFRHEIGAKLSRAQNGIIWIAVGAVLGIGALIVLLGAASIGISTLGIHLGWSCLIVGAIAAVLAFVFLRVGMSSLAPANLVPTQSTHQIRKDLEMAKEQLR